MAGKSKQSSAVSPAEEDRNLFKTYGGPIAVDLTPQIHRNPNGDVLVRGFFKQSVEIVVVFSGRRVAEVGALQAQLKAVDSQLRRAAVAAQRPEPMINRIRMPVQIKGSWRHSYTQDADGKETREYQLIAARWAFADSNGQLAQFGVAPVASPTASLRKKSYILNMREFDAVPQTNRQE